MKLSHRVAIIVMAGLLPLVGLEVYNGYTLYNSRTAEIEAAAQRQAQLASSYLDRIVAGVRSMLLTVAQSPSIRSMDVESCSAFMQQLASKLDYLGALSVVDMQGKITCAAAPDSIGVSIADRSYFKTVLGSTDVVLGEFTVGRVSKVPVLPLAYPLTDNNGERTGALVTSLRLDWLSEQMKQRGIPENGSITIADRNGTILARQPVPEKFIGTKIPEAYRHLLNEPGPGAIKVLSQDGTERILGYIPLRSNADGFYVSAGLSTQSAFASLRSAALRQSALGLAVILASGLAALLMSQQFVTKPLSRLLNTVRGWQAGDLSARTGLKREEGEIGNLGHEFDSAMDQIASREETIRILLREVAHRSKNQMAIVMSMAKRLAKSHDTVDDYVAALTERMMGLSASQDLLLISDNKPIELEKLIESQLATFGKGLTSRVTYRGPQVFVAADAARFLGMAVHELTTNALKHGALSTDGGKVRIMWDIDRASCDYCGFEWSESGGPPVSKPQNTGFGRVLVEKLVPQQLKGTVALDFRRDGLRWFLKFPMQLTG